MAHGRTWYAIKNGEVIATAELQKEIYLDFDKRRSRYIRKGLYEIGSGPDIVTICHGDEIRDQILKPPIINEK